MNMEGKRSGPSITYHFRIVAINSSGTRYGSDRTFTPLSATGPPVAITNSATNVASSSPTLNGSFDPHGLTTTVHFQYGKTTSYGHTAASQTKANADGTIYVGGRFTTFNGVFPDGNPESNGSLAQLKIISTINSGTFFITSPG